MDSAEPDFWTGAVEPPELRQAQDQLLVGVMAKVTFEEFFQEHNRLMMDHLGQIFSAGLAAMNDYNSPTASALAVALKAMEQKANEIAKSWER